MSSDQNRQQIIDWLSPCDPSVNHIAAKKKHVEGTGRWFLESNEFNDWKEGTKQSLWLHGIPGAGKTVICSTIIEEIHNSKSDIECVYFYFDFNDKQKQTVDGFLRSVIVQICACRHDFITNVQSVFDKCNHGTQQPNEDVLVEILLALLQGRRTFLFVDALDECTERSQMAQLLKRLIGSVTDLSLLITSRQEQDIKAELQDPMDLILSIQSAEVKVDVELYVRKALEKDSNLKCCRKIKDEVISKLVEGADGM